MIAYHGTPIGGTMVDAARFLNGRHALVSFANQQNMAIVAESLTYVPGVKIADDAEFGGRKLIPINGYVGDQAQNGRAL